MAIAVLLSAVALRGSIAAAGVMAQRPPAVPQSHADQSAPVAIHPDHPRLIVGGYRGVSVAALRAACQRPELRDECVQIGGRHVLDDAMRSLLFEDQAAAERVAAVLRNWRGCTPDDVGAEHSDWGGWALAYDWVWPALSNEDRERTEGNLARCGTMVADRLESNDPHLWHGYTSLAATLALMALAADPRRGQPVLIEQAVAHFRRTALEAYAVVGGAWPEGYNYERSHFFSADPPNQYVIDALRAWDSAVERDHLDHASIFETIAVEEGDWLRGLGYHLLYGTLDPYGADGKLTLLRGGDMPTGQAWPNKQYRPFTDSIARTYGDGVLAGWGRMLERDWAFVGGTGTYHSIHRYSLPYNLPLDVTTQSPARLPLGRIWGRADLGYVLARSGWADGETTLGYRAGKWFTGHQHMDQGHIDIWRKGPLLVDGGVYADWGSTHREAYYLRTVAHNTLLVHQAGEDFEEHPSSGVNVNDDGQRVHTYNRRGCAQCMQSVAEWRANVGAGLHFEAGRIDAFEDGPGYTVVSSDLSAAYNSAAYTTPDSRPKVERVQRDLVFVRPHVLLIADRVRRLDGAEPPRAAFHFPRRPRLDDERVLAGTAENGILQTTSAAFELDNGSGGRLIGRVLEPGAAGGWLIGGPDYRYWVDGANRDDGAAPHEGSPAEPGRWRLELSPPATPAPPPDTLLVVGLTITDEGGRPAHADRPSAVGTDPMAPEPVLAVAVTTTGRTQIVLRSAAVPRAAVRYASVSLDGPAGGVLLADLVPGAEYRLAASAGAALTAGTASAEGVLVLAAPLAGGLRLGQCPSPAAAGPDWRFLCGEGPPATVTALATSPAPPTPTATGTAPPTSTAPAATPAPAALYLPRALRTSPR
jgi:hypothetical protein